MGFWKWLGLATWKKLRWIQTIKITKEDIAFAQTIIGIVGGVVVFIFGVPIAFYEFLFTRVFPSQFLIGALLVSGLLFLIGLHGVYQIEGEDC